MSIGRRIKERRKELGLSADELGFRLGKNRATIYRYEKGDIENLPLDILEPIATILETTPQYLMGWDNSKPIPVHPSAGVTTTIGRRLRVLRESRGLTLEEVGNYIGVNEETMQRYETGRIDITCRTVVKLARHLHTSPSYIMGWTNDPSVEITEKMPTPVSASGHPVNIVKIAGRDGSYVEKRLTDDQVKALRAIVDQFPDASDDL